MRPYLVTTGSLFGLIVAVHIWRGVVESATLARDPWFILITLTAVAMCAWAFALLRRTSPRRAG